MSGIPETAVLMIDVQNMYKSDDGMRDRLGWPPIWRMEEVVAECGLLLDRARSLGVPVVYSRAVARKDGADRIPPQRLLADARRLEDLPADPAEEAWKQEIMDEIAPQPGDIVMEKGRPSFFEFTALEAVLMNLGIRRLIIAGLQTNVCVEATCRSALAHNYDVGIPEDAVSTDGPALHEGALDAMRVLYAEVAPWRELLAEDATWSRRFTTPNYGRDASYWDETLVAR